MTPEGLALVKRFEGCRLTAYRDMVGVLTIGYGHTDGVQDGDTITQDQADDMLDQELDRFQQKVLALCGTPNPTEADAMTSLAYNIGLGAFAGSSVLRNHNLYDYQGAADSFLLWTRAGGVIVPGLVARRQAERMLYLT